MPSHDALQPKTTGSQGGRRDATDAVADARPHAVSQALALEGRDEAVDVVEGEAPATSLARDAIYRRSLALADLIAATFAFVFTIEVLGADSLGPWTVLAVLTIVPVCKLAGLYDRDEHRLHKTTLDEAPSLFRVAALYTLLAFLAGGAIVEGTFGRTQAAVLWGLLLISMLAGRWLARAIAGAIVPKERCVIISNAEAAHWLNTKLVRCNGARIEVVGRVPIRPDDTSVNELPLLGSFDRMEELLAAYNVDRALIAPGTGEGDHRLLNVIRVVKRLGVRVSVLPRLFEAVGSAYEFDEVEGATLLGVRRHGLSRSSQLVKRSFDLVVASIVAVLLAPLMAMIAVAIKLDSRGPVFFRQRRMGCEDRVFRIFKFRTMVADAEERKAELGDRNEAGGGLFKIEDDPRITRVGRFLRRTSLDELPQLLNVLHGDMSLVGPRPLVLDEDRLIEGLHRHRLLVPPGVTGLWQVFGSARIPLNEMVKIDYLYGANWSLWLDIKILLRTVPVVLGRRGL